ncbi:amidohydrolase [Nocardia sp. alder85J]|uniref:amidohydrolase n=1 Tax=Nocardia sp. alder85J TaxID=2862949 RepID=UPI001CD6FAC1|nr:amidohydrolase [Nocardia sp. alder85J]MCX4094927.1 amidohydrolase [Nocardia sp. alder85J]
MSTVAELKARVCAAIDREAGRIVELCDDILRHPETGYRETRTAALVADRFTAMGLTPQTGLARTGVKARLRGRAPGPTAAVLGELDSLLIPGHPYADPVTGAAHACGHNAQIASMIGAGLGLAPVMGELDGDVVLFAVPAEECIEVGWRMSLRDKGEIHYTAGKAELIAAGHFDDVDLAMLTHTGVAEPPLAFGMRGNGSLVKRVRFHGRSAHAGGMPWAGISSYKAATVAIAAIDAHREFFRDTDAVRVHHLITHSGDSVSAIPARTELEMLIRARTIDAMRDASARVDRALRGGALAMGADVEITTAVSFLPFQDDAPLAELTAGTASALLGAAAVGHLAEATGGSTDMGDLGTVMPVVHPLAASGCATPFHGSEYVTADPVAAAVVPAKVMACAVVDLLADGAGAARSVIERSGPKLSREEFVRLHESLSSSEYFRGGLLADAE